MVQPLQPQVLDRLTQHIRAERVGMNKRIRVQNRAVDVRFGGEIHDRIDIVALDRLAHGGCIADIAAHKRKAGVAFSRREILEVAGVG